MPIRQVFNKVVLERSPARLDDLFPSDLALACKAHRDILMHRAVEERARLADAYDARAYPLA